MPINGSAKVSDLIKNRLLQITTAMMGISIIVSAFLFYERNIFDLSGILLFLVSILTLGVVLLKIFFKESLSKAKNLILMELVIIIMILIVLIIKSSPTVSPFFIPSAVSAVLLTVLLSPGPAFVTLLIVCFLAVVIADLPLANFFVFLAGGIVAIYSSLNVRNRKDLNRSGLYVLLANAVSITAVSLMDNLSVAKIGMNVAWGAGNALITIVIASGLIPLLESVFSITTDIRLLELGDFNQPLLKRLMLEAPGTYHHSLMVGNLVDNACEQIGANSLLARVGAYYHDIGKLTSPQYFIENQVHNRDAHKNLKANISALILKRHVKDGLTLAEEYKLDKVITDMIEQHHGNTLIEYFYKKVLDEENGNQKVDEKEYRYPGPRPLTKEGGVLMLADSVEAACRTLDEPTYSRISGLVTKVINNKFIDNQLNNCDLTLANLESIQKSFTNTLSGIYHSRIEYPEDHEEN